MSISASMEHQSPWLLLNCVIYIITQNSHEALVVITGITWSYKIDQCIFCHCPEIEMKPEECKLWRVSFSYIEKKFLVGADGKNRKHPEVKTTRKKLIKLLKDDLNQLRKRWGGELQFSSYFIKNVAFHFYNKPSLVKDENWQDMQNLCRRYREALVFIIQCLRECCLDFFFFPRHNLLADLNKSELGRREKAYLENGFLTCLKTI